METQKETLTKYTILKSILQRLAFTVVNAILLFTSAGTLKWDSAWIYLSLFLVVSLLIMIIQARNNPQNLILSKGTDKNVSKADNQLIKIYNILLILYPISAGILYRYRIGMLPSWCFSLGILLVIAGSFLSLWTIHVNKYFETDIKIHKAESNNDSTIVQNGPYKIVRHPGYAGSILMWMATPLLLRNGLLFILSFCFLLFFIERTQIEDKLLQHNLKNYKDYSARVKYKLIYGIW